VGGPDVRITVFSLLVEILLAIRKAYDIRFVRRKYFARRPLLGLLLINIVNLNATGQINSCLLFCIAFE